MYTFTTRLGMVIAIMVISIITIFGSITKVHACAEDDTNSLFIETKNGDFYQIVAIDLDKNYLAVVHIEESIENVQWRSYPIETTKLFYSDSRGKLYQMKIDTDSMKVITKHGDTLPMPIRIQVKLDE